MIIWAIGVLAALAYLVQIHGTASMLRSIMKTVPVVLFALAAFQLNAPWAIGVGLLFSAVGDWALSRDGERAFLAGLAAFAIAHLLYIVVFASEFYDLRLWPVMVLMLALALSTRKWLLPFVGGLKGAVAVYVGLITVMMLSALALPPVYWLATLGAASFVLSDLILALRLFRLDDNHRHARRASEALWVFYIAGQALIAYAGASF